MATTGNGNSIYRQFSGTKAAADPKGAVAASKDKPLPYRQLQRKPASPLFSEEKAQHSRVSVHIAGMQYRLVAPDKEGEVYVRAIADKADQLIMQIQKSTPGMSMMSITVLSLVNVMDELYQKDLRIKELEHELSKVAAAKETDKSNYMHLREINWELKKEVLRLQSMIDAYENTEDEEYETTEKKKLLPLEELEYDVLEQESSDD